MKKVLFLLLLLSLIACGNDLDETNSFIESFNENAYEFTGVGLIDVNNLENIRQEKNGKWRRLYESKFYTLEAKYNDNEKLTGYNLSIDKNQAYEKMEGFGYEATLVLIKTLGLDREEFNKYYQKSLEDEDLETVVYVENGYEITLINFMFGKEYNGMVINIDLLD